MLFERGPGYQVKAPQFHKNQLGIFHWKRGNQVRPIKERDRLLFHAKRGGDSRLGN